MRAFFYGRTYTFSLIIVGGTIGASLFGLPGFAGSYWFIVTGSVY